MKKKIIILGSTGSIGTSTLKIFDKDKKNFSIFLLSTNTNIKKLFYQAKKFNCKNLIISNQIKFNEAINLNKQSDINIYNSFEELPKIIKKNKIYYTMISILGIDGLKPSIILSKYSKNLAIVNKEALISGWDLIKKNIKKYKVKFTPVDSEHFSIFNTINNYSPKEIERIYITASGGPFINYPKNKFSKILPYQALKHPNWKMGKKITIDSATLMNKVFEVIEARNIFNIPYNKISILTHPNSYIHAIVLFKNGLIKIVAHEPDMKIPISNSIYKLNNTFIKSKKLNLEILNNAKLKKIDISKFPLITLLNNLPNYNSLYETILITVNDFFVEKFLNNKINFLELNNFIIKFLNLKEFRKYKLIKANNIKKIYQLKNYVSFKLHTLGI